MGRKKKWTESFKQEFINDYKKLSKGEMNEKYNLSDETISEYIKVFRRELNQKVGYHEWDEKSMKKFLKDYNNFGMEGVKKLYSLKSSTISEYKYRFRLALKNFKFTGWDKKTKAEFVAYYVQEGIYATVRRYLLPQKLVHEYYLKFTQ